MKGFKGKYILTDNGLVKDKMIVVSDGIIKDIGQTDNMKNLYDLNNIVGNDHLIIPGFINLHTHVAMSSMLGYGDDRDITTWLEDYIWPLENKLNQNDIYWSSLKGILELLRSGTTTIVDHYFNANIVAKAAKKAGIRGVLAETLMDLNDKKIPISEGEDFIRNFKDEELITPWVGPHAPDTCSKSLLKQVKKLSNEFNTGIHIHLSQSKDEVKKVKERHNMTPTELLKNLNLLGSDVIAAHGVYLTKKDIKILGTSKSNIAHCAISLSKLDGQVAPIRDLIEQGANVGIGNDCFTFDMFPELLSVGVLNKFRENDPTIFPGKKIFDMSTRNGAKAIGLDVGKIEVGKKADFALLNSSEYLNHIYSDLIYHLNQKDVEYTVVNGEIRYKNGEFPGINKERVFEKVKKVNKNLIPDNRGDL